MQEQSEISTKALRRLKHFPLLSDLPSSEIAEMEIMFMANYFRLSLVVDPISSSIWGI
jgi:hypothetical protein